MICTATGHGRRIRERLELQPRAVVAEQDAAIEVAHDDALVELGHQRRQPVALLLDRQARLADARLHVILQTLPLISQAIHGLGDALQLRRTGRLEPARRIGTHQQANLVGQRRWRRNAVVGEGFHQDRRRPRTDHPDHDQQTQARVEDGLEHRPLVGPEIPPEGYPGAAKHPQDERRSPENDQPCLAFGLIPASPAGI